MVSTVSKEACSHHRKPVLLKGCSKEKAALAFLLRAQSNRARIAHFSHHAVYGFSVAPASCGGKGGDRRRTQQPLFDPSHDHALPARRWQHAKHINAVGVVSIFNSALQLRRRLQPCGVPGMTSDDRIRVNVNYESIH
jgi:hypothetical protein